MFLHKSKVKVQYPVLRTVQSTFYFTSLTDLFTQTPSRLLWEASSHVLQLMCEGCSYTYPPLSIVMYSFIHLSELEQCRVPRVLTPQHRFRTRVLVVESPKLYPWVMALYMMLCPHSCTLQMLYISLVCLFVCSTIISTSLGRTHCTTYPLHHQPPLLQYELYMTNRNLYI